MKNILFTTLILLVLTSCAELETYVPGLAPTQTATQHATLAPDPVASRTPSATKTTNPAPAPQWSVCTGVERGSLNVRSCAGTACSVMGLLGEGESVSLTGAKEARGSDNWIYISSPRQGWVNERYLCVAESVEEK